MLGSGWCHLPHDLLHSTLLYSVHFLSSITTCLKKTTFFLHISREVHVEIESRRFFPLMWNPNIKMMNITKLVQMIFSTWFGYFECASYLSCGIMLTVLNQCLDFFTINFNLCIWPRSMVQWEISSIKLYKPPLTGSVTVPSQYTA